MAYNTRTAATTTTTTAAIFPQQLRRQQRQQPATHNIFTVKRVLALLLVLQVALLSSALAQTQSIKLGTKCQHDMDCTDFIKGSSCSASGYCECAPYFVQYNTTTCLSSQLLGGDCVLDDQCTMKVANSSCLDGACRCVEGFLQFRKHTCLGPALPGAVCYSHAHCQMFDGRTHCDFLIPNLFGRCQCTAPAKLIGGFCMDANEAAAAATTTSSTAAPTTISTTISTTTTSTTTTTPATSSTTSAPAVLSPILVDRNEVAAPEQIPEADQSYAGDDQSHVDVESAPEVTSTTTTQQLLTPAEISEVHTADENAPEITHEVTAAGADDYPYKIEEDYAEQEQQQNHKHQQQEEHEQDHHALEETHLNGQHVATDEEAPQQTVELTEATTMSPETPHQPLAQLTPGQDMYEDIEEEEDVAAAPADDTMKFDYEAAEQEELNAENTETALYVDEAEDSAAENTELGTPSQVGVEKQGELESAGHAEHQTADEQTEQHSGSDESISSVENEQQNNVGPIEVPAHESENESEIELEAPQQQSTEALAEDPKNESSASLEQGAETTAAGITEIENSQETEQVNQDVTKSTELPEEIKLEQVVEAQQQPILAEASEVHEVHDYIKPEQAAAVGAPSIEGIDDQQEKAETGDALTPAQHLQSYEKGDELEHQLATESNTQQTILDESSRNEEEPHSTASEQPSLEETIIADEAAIPSADHLTNEIDTNAQPSEELDAVDEATVAPEVPEVYEEQQVEHQANAEDNLEHLTLQEPHINEVAMTTTVPNDNHIETVELAHVHPADGIIKQEAASTEVVDMQTETTHVENEAVTEATPQRVESHKPTDELAHVQPETDQQHDIPIIPSDALEHTNPTDAVIDPTEQLDSNEQFFNSDLSAQQSTEHSDEATNLSVSEASLELEHPASVAVVTAANTTQTDLDYANVESFEMFNNNEEAVNDEHTVKPENHLDVDNEVNAQTEPNYDTVNQETGYLTQQNVPAVEVDSDSDNDSEFFEENESFANIVSDLMSAEATTISPNDIMPKLDQQETQKQDHNEVVPDLIAEDSSINEAHAVKEEDTTTELGQPQNADKLITFYPEIQSLDEQLSNDIETHKEVLQHTEEHEVNQAVAAVTEGSKPDKSDTQTLSPEELPFDMSAIDSVQPQALESDNLVLETTTIEPGNEAATDVAALDSEASANENNELRVEPVKSTGAEAEAQSQTPAQGEEATATPGDIVEITTQTMLGLASRVTLMEPAAPIATTLKPHISTEAAADSDATPDPVKEQPSTENLLATKPSTEIRKRVELGSEAVSLGLNCLNDRQCQLADPNAVCNARGVCDCAAAAPSSQSYCSAESTGCAPGTFQCRSSGVCISWFFVCDGRPDCNDDSDEECTYNARLNKTCPAEAFLCEQSGRCISRAARCDGRKQCPHGEDEIGCTALRSGECPPHTFRCGSGECLPEYEYCNAIISCKDGSDEPPQLCGSRSMPTFFLRLLNAGGLLENEKAYCPHRCSNGRCRSTAIVCSGRDGCGDGTDEQTCSVCRCPAPASESLPAYLARHRPMPLW